MFCANRGDWIKSYLSNRSYQVQIDGVLFEEAPCLSGVPQGSVLGPLLFLLYINDLPAALGNSAFLFADDVKMVFPGSQSRRLLSSLSSAWTWAGKRGLSINPYKCACLTVGNLPPISPSFSAEDTDHRIPQVTDVRDLGVPLDTTFTASTHCIEAVNTARRLLFLVRRSFFELSKTAFTPLYCALVRPHLEYAMEANAPTLRADINQLQRIQRLATRLVRGFRHVPYEERLCKFNLFSLERRRLRADLILAFKIFKGEVDLNPSEFFLRPPRAGLRGHTYRLLQGPSRLRRRSGAFSARIVKFWNRLPSNLALSPSVFLSSKNSWTVNGPK